MATLSTKALVLSTIKYGDTSLIVRCFTLESGIKSYLIKGVLSSKRGPIKAAYFQVLTQLHIEANHNAKGRLNSLKEVRVLHPYTSIYANIFKQTISLFLSEVLNSTIREEEANEGLFLYLETSFVWLDTHSEISNFHLLFLINLTRYLGFYPDLRKRELDIFHLQEGSFVSSSNDQQIITGTDLLQFKKLLGIHFDRMNSLRFSKSERQQVLKIILRYYQFHVDGFRLPKSLAILESVFS